MVKWRSVTCMWMQEDYNWNRDEHSTQTSVTPLFADHPTPETTQFLYWNLLFDVQQDLPRIDSIPLVDCKGEHLLAHCIVARRHPYRRLHRFQLDDPLIIVLDYVPRLDVELPHVGREGGDDCTTGTCRCLSLMSVHCRSSIRYDQRHTLRDLVSGSLFLCRFVREVLLEQLFFPSHQLYPHQR